jgi:hypothetical protein
MQEPTFTFVSISTAKPGKLDDLVRVARRPNELLDDRLDGVVARQVSVDRDRNAVVVFATFTEREPLYEYLASDQGRSDHDDSAELQDIIETFEMFELTPVSGRLA